jgi:hypothetical protein
MKGISRAFHTLAEGTDPAESGRARAEADDQTRRALKLDPDNDEIRKLRDQKRKRSNQRIIQKNISLP